MRVGRGRGGCPRGLGAPQPLHRLLMPSDDGTDDIAAGGDAAAGVVGDVAVAAVAAAVAGGADGDDGSAGDVAADGWCPVPDSVPCPDSLCYLGFLPCRPFPSSSSFYEAFCCGESCCYCCGRCCYYCGCVSHHQPPWRHHH